MSEQDEHPTSTRPPPPPIDWDIMRDDPPPTSLWRAAMEVVRCVFGR